MEIRDLRPDEHDSWFVLRRELWPDSTREDLEKQLQLNREDPHRNAVLVAVLPGAEIAGFIEVSVREWAEGCETQPVGYIEGWYVKAAHRRAGIGRRLVEAAESWAQSRGCTEMGSDAELENRVSRLAHRALGYSEVTQLVCFSKRLADQEAGI